MRVERSGNLCPSASHSVSGRPKLRLPPLSIRRFPPFGNLFFRRVWKKSLVGGMADG